MVTGASGYLASWIIQQLLEQGHIVHGTVRNLEDKNKIQHLLELMETYPEQLTLFECDLTKEGDFEQAMEQCEIVIHTASPYFLDKPKNIEEELIIPAVQGTKNILNSVNRHRTVKRVILTSSVVTLFNNAKDLTARVGHIIQEHDNNSNQDKTYNPYAYSKTKAEILAREMNNKQQHWDLITIHPGAIFGPSLSRRIDSTSVNMIMQFLNGSFKSGVPKLWLGLVDVRDVAQLHIFAAINKKANGKYIAVSKSLNLLEIARLIDVTRFAISDKLPKKEVPKPIIWLLAPLLGIDRKFIANNVNYPIRFDHSRSEADLEFQYRLPTETLNDHVAQLLSDNII